jgi:Pyruvate/2-oxoacid:ferredoxin oxidoreductase delta subunit
VAKEAGEEASMAERMGEYDERQPLKRILLKNSLKMVAEGFGDDTQINGSFSFVTGKRIDEMACNNCQECAMFCPTGAMSIRQDNAGIIFQVGKCIHCGICNEVCQPRAIDDEPHFDLVDFAFDRMALLVEHTLEICEECKVAFPYKGGEKICDRCKTFTTDYADLFTLAKDLD